MSNIYLAAGEAVAGKDFSNYQSLIMIGAAVLFFYFIIWRPEQKRRKKLDNLRKSLKRGDRVIAMGMIATVDEVREKTVILKQYDGAKIEVLAGVISEVESPEAAKAN